MRTAEYTLPERPKIAIVGTGALGAYYGGRIAQHGHDVHFLLRADYAAVKEHGWRVVSSDGDFELPAERVNAYDDPGKMPKADLVLVTLKTTANDQFEPLIRPLLHESTAILTLQNGLGNEERLAELFGERHVLGGTAFVCINRTGPGQIHHICDGLITLGEFGRPATPRARQIGQMLVNSKVPAKVLEDLRRARWEKLVWNVPFNGLSAALDLTTDLLIAKPDGEALVRRVMAEVIAAARGVDVDLPDSLIDAKVTATRGMGPYQTSMHVDMREGRAMEVEAILGCPVRAAQGAGVAVPMMEAVYRLLLLRDGLRDNV
ncbi:MAG TPA: 2-dehydropantoate 2-reductase [Tepidisphaeraceae bacterium]|nr:2-dehydropantoate 2-reductase [Tepidisphaeraceae bacterium]